jgi:RNA polymerase sigma-70 factor, ECF subfamily
LGTANQEGGFARCDLDSAKGQSDQTRAIGSPLDELVARHQTSVWRYLRALGCDCALADDLTQETFLAVLRRPFEQINDAATAFYLRRVAYHLLVSYRRRNKRVTLTDQVEFLDSDWMRWAGFDAGDSALEYLADCFRRLSERARLALKMRFQDQSSREQIAEALGITEHGAKNLMQRAKSLLKDCVENKLK